MIKTADAVVIGAGINGASTALNLQKRGLKNVVLIEKYLLASGGTGRSAALVRQHYSTEELVRMVKRSTEVFHHFDDQIGGDPGFVNCGWAFLIPDYASEGFKRNMEMQQRLGIQTQEISREELKDLEPRLELEDVAHIAYEKGSGFADPHATTYSYVQRFVERGGELMQMTAVQGLILENGAIRGVHTSRGDIATNVVVNAAGPWAQFVAKWAGLDIPIQVTREEEIILETKDVGGSVRLAVSDMALAIYYRPHGSTHTLLGRGFPKDYEYVDPDRYKEQVDTDFIEECFALFVKRIPKFEKALFVNAYTGLYDVTPDWYPILGKVEEVPGFYMCAGFSGHGFKTGPAVGELMAEEVLDGQAHTVDIRRFHLSRFARGELFLGGYGANRA
jgi:sarcosine oxidase subunit beta